MADLSVEICGMKFENPILPAAGPTVWDGKAMLRCVKGGAGGIVAKTISTTAAQVPQPCMAEYGRGSMLNTELWSEYPPEQYIEHEYAIARQAGVPLIISLGYTAEQIAQLARRVRPFADALELSTHYIGDDLQPMIDAIRAAKDAVDVPVFVKFSPFRDVQRAAEAAQQVGADGIVAVNSYGPCFGIDIETGAPLMGSREGYGWLSGQAIKAIALRCVYDVARTVDLPIFGVGGISRGEDAVEFFMAGASAVQICTVANLRGPEVHGRIVHQIDKWLDSRGYASVREIQGLTLRRVRERAFRTTHMPPNLDVDACIGCAICPTSCVYGALKMIGEPKTPTYKVKLNPDLCWGCGICATRCPTRALTIEGVSA